MKILHLGKFYPPAKGGMETVLELICERTSQEFANEVLVANTDGKSTEERRHGVDVVRLAALAKIGAVTLCPTLPWRLAHARADLIVIHEPNPMGLLAYFLARPKTPLVVWFHSEVIRPSWKYRLFYRPFLKFALEHAARVIVASPPLAESAKQLDEWRSKCVVIPYGVDLARARATTTRTRRIAAIREQYQIPIVLFVGRLVAYKGVDVLIDAMREVRAVAVLVGDGPQRPVLEEKVASLGLSDRVAFLGEVDDEELASLYQACQVFVLPSVTRQEAFGVVQLEAMACGKPIVSTDLGTGVAWVNQHRETGLVVRPRDAVALGAAINDLLGDEGLRESLGQAGIRRTKSIFAADRMIELTRNLYRDVLGHHVERKTVA